MGRDATDRSGTGDAKRLPLTDLALVLASVVVIVLGNVGVVRALDVALDALHR
jgi:hypothetical protein